MVYRTLLLRGCAANALGGAVIYLAAKLIGG
jgi:hypothetical protein